jgi:hypothetical protein
VPDPDALGVLIDLTFLTALRYLGHPPSDPLRFRHLVAESLLRRLRRQLANIISLAAGQADGSSSGVAGPMTNPGIRVTQTVAETVYTPTTIKIRATQTVIETVYRELTIDLRYGTANGSSSGLGVLSSIGGGGARVQVVWVG